jgi:hypothetical protein
VIGVHARSREYRTHALEALLTEGGREIRSQHAHLVAEADVLVDDGDVGLPLVWRRHRPVAAVDKAQGLVDERVLLLRRRAADHAPLHVRLENLLEESSVDELQHYRIVLQQEARCAQQSRRAGVHAPTAAAAAAAAARGAHVRMASWGELEYAYTRTMPTHTSGSSSGGETTRAELELAFASCICKHTADTRWAGRGCQARKGGGGQGVERWAQL